MYLYTIPNSYSYSLITCTHAEPGMVNNLECSPVPSAEGLSLSIAWQPPSVNTESVAVYEVTVKEYKQLQGTRDIAPVDLPTPFSEQVYTEGQLISTVIAEKISEYID